MSGRGGLKSLGRDPSVLAPPAFLLQSSPFAVAFPQEAHPHLSHFKPTAPGGQAGPQIALRHSV